MNYGNRTSDFHRSTLLVYVTIFFAVALEFLPWPNFILPIKPNLPLLLLMYWSLNAPKLVGFIFAIVIGLLIDLSNYSYLGVNILGCVVVVYLTNVYYSRFVLLGEVAQAVYVVLFLAVGQGLMFLTTFLELGLEAINRFSTDLFLPCVSGGLLWLMLPLILQSIKKFLSGRNKFGYE